MLIQVDSDVLIQKIQTIKQDMIEAAWTGQLSEDGLEDALDALAVLCIDLGFVEDNQTA